MLKHERVTRLLRRRIEKGVYPPGSRLPGETDLPEQLGAGRQTVVRALNELVREGLLVRRRGDGTYIADLTQPPLMPGRHLRIGLIQPRSVNVADPTAGYWGGMITGLLSAWGVDLVPTEAKKVGEREVTRVTWNAVNRGVCVEAVGESRASFERHPPLKAVEQGNYDGLIVLSVIEEDWLEQLLALHLPTVLVDFPNERFAARADQVNFDPRTGYRAAVRAMKARGARRLHFVGTYMDVPTLSADWPREKAIKFMRGKKRVDPDSFQRLAAFRAAMEENDLSAEGECVHFSFPEIKELLEKVLALPPDRRPEGFLCHGMHHAEKLLKAFHERGLPLLAAGAASGAYHGPAWSIFADSSELGRTAAELLLWRLQRSERPPLRVGVPMMLMQDQKEGKQGAGSGKSQTKEWVLEKNSVQ